MLTHNECDECGLFFKNPIDFLSPEEESRRYQFHQNDPEKNKGNADNGYIQFLNTFLSPLLTFIKTKKTLLDFGSGPFPMLAQLIKATRPDLQIETWDPFFTPEKKLSGHFDVITCTEVVEHFHGPAKEFGTLLNLLSKDGILGIKTEFKRVDIDYKTWWYKNDPTHVVFYTEKTFEYIAKKHNLNILYNDHKSIIIFQKNINN